LAFKGPSVDEDCRPEFWFETDDPGLAASAGGRLAGNGNLFPVAAPPGRSSFEAPDDAVFERLTQREEGRIHEF
jgi:hypothetical protein